MRIGIDARELMGRPTGVGRYLAQLLTTWAHTAPAMRSRHEFILFGPEPLPAAMRAQIEPLGVVERVVAGAGGTAWEQTALRRAVNAGRLDLFFAPAYTAPIALRCPSAVTVHDLSFCAHPEWFRWREGLRRRVLTRAAARAASVVLTDSLFSAGEIDRHIGIPRSRVRVIPLGVTRPSWSAAPSPPADARRARDPLVLYVGSIFNRRRVPDLIQAFAGVARLHPEARLLIIGENRTHPREDLDEACRAAGVAGRVSIRAYVTDEDLADAYRAASAFAFLSEYEGFGLTPLEALACGVPVVVLDTPVARETCGEAASYVAKGDIPGTTAAITDLLLDPARRADRLAAAPAVLARYSWDSAARATMDALEAAGR